MKFNIKSLFTLDLRALALMRIAIAITIITDLIIRITDLEAHYTNRGILPLEALHNYLWNPYYFSIHAAVSSLPLELVLFIINFLCAFCLLLGYRTKLFTVICWLFVLSLHNRNPLIEQAGDDFLRLILFWSIFLPWGYFYSIDAQKYLRSKPSTQYTSMAGFAYLCQVAFLYFFSATLKTSAQWTKDFTAVYYALSLDQILTPIGKFMYSLVWLLKPLTASVFYIELLLPLILFIPFFTSYTRIIFFVVLTFMHVGFNLCLNVGLFSLISIVGMIGLIPGPFIDKILRWKNAFFNRTKLWFKQKASIFPLKDTPKPFFPKENVATGLFASLILIYTLLWNIENLGKKVIPENMVWVAQVLRVDQYWGMFAPEVFKDDGWFILSGKAKNGKEVDLYKQSHEIDFDKPEYAADYYKNDRWRKYHEKLLLIVNSHFRPYYCNYLLWKWNSSHPKDTINSLQIIYMKEITQPDYKIAPPTKEMLCECNLN